MIVTKGENIAMYVCRLALFAGKLEIALSFSNIDAEEHIITYRYIGEARDYHIGQEIRVYVTFSDG